MRCPIAMPRSIDIAAQDPNIDGLLAITCPQGMAEPSADRRAFEALRAFHWETGAGELDGRLRELPPGADILNHAGIPTFQFPDTAARVFYYMWRYSYNLRGLYETPVLREEADEGPDRVRAQQIIENARRAGRTLLTEVESKQLLAAYGMPTVQTRSCQQ